VCNLAQTFRRNLLSRGEKITQSRYFPFPLSLVPTTVILLYFVSYFILVKRVDLV
jgi:hypothetical protein